jgi:hypothetical protein
VYTNAINQGNVENIIKTSCVGDQLKLIVNDTTVLEATDGSFSSGQFALFTTAYSNVTSTSPARVEFDNLLIAQP